MTDGIGLDLGQLSLAIAKRPQAFGHGAVDDFEIAAAGQFLEFHQREIRLDAGGVAIHHQADGAGGGHDRDLRIAIAMRLAEFQGAVPGGAGVGDQTLVGAGGGVERNRRHRQLLVALSSRHAPRGDGCG